MSGNNNGNTVTVSYKNKTCTLSTGLTVKAAKQSLSSKYHCSY